MDSEKKKNNVLFEDLQMGSTNYLGVGKGQGQSAMQLKPGKITLLDLLKQAKDWDEEMHRAPNRLPYPLQDGLSDQLGQLFVDASQVMDKVAQSTKNSIIKDNKQAMKSIKKIHRKMSIICQAIKSVAEDLDGLSVGTSSPHDHA